MAKTDPLPPAFSLFPYSYILSFPGHGSFPTEPFPKDLSYSVDEAAQSDIALHYRLLLRSCVVLLKQCGTHELIPTLLVSHRQKEVLSK